MMRPVIDPPRSRRMVTRRRLSAGLLPLLFACGEPYPSAPTTARGVPSNPTPAPPFVPKEVAYIYLADADGTVRGPLTEGTWPSWSPDGRRIVFERNERVLVIDADGANEKELVQGRWPTWSPDGARVAFVADRAIQVMDADGSSMRKLLSPTINIISQFDDVGLLAWSPDGAFIAFETLSLANYAKVILVSADGSGEHRLTSSSSEPDTVEEDGPTWSPDGSRLVYWSTGIGLSTVDRNGGDRRRIEGHGLDVGFYSRPSWSPDGRAITFGSLDGSIFAISPSGGIATLLIQNGMHAAWSPDGKSIAFVRIHER